MRVEDIEAAVRALAKAQSVVEQAVKWLDLRKNALAHQAQVDMKLVCIESRRDVSIGLLMSDGIRQSLDDVIRNNVLDCVRTLTDLDMDIPAEVETVAEGLSEDPSQWMGLRPTSGMTLRDALFNVEQTIKNTPMNIAADYNWPVAAPLIENHPMWRSKTLFGTFTQDPPRVINDVKT